MISMKKSVMSAAVVLAFSAGAAQAVYTPLVTTTGNNFTMTSASGGLTGGTNDVVFSWDGTLRTALVTDGSYNATLSSLSPFSSNVWTAKNVNLYAPGTYTFNAAGPAGNPSGTSTTMYTMTVGAGQVGAHMLFDWSTSADIDVLVLWDMNKSWSATTSAPFKTFGCSTAQALLVPECTGTTKNTSATVWSGVSIDTNADTNAYPGTTMIDGPFAGQSANFNVKGIQATPLAAVPVPAAVWLLGSGLLGLVGVARRKMAA